jgi:hypothetical protein
MGQATVGGGPVRGGLYDKRSLCLMIQNKIFIIVVFFLRQIIVVFPDSFLILFCCEAGWLVWILLSFVASFQWFF